LEDILLNATEDSIKALCHILGSWIISMNTTEPLNHGKSPAHQELAQGLSQWVSDSVQGLYGELGKLRTVKLYLEGEANVPIGILFAKNVRRGLR